MVYMRHSCKEIVPRVSFGVHAAYGVRAKKWPESASDFFRFVGCVRAMRPKVHGTRRDKCVERTPTGLHAVVSDVHVLACCVPSAESVICADDHTSERKVPIDT